MTPTTLAAHHLSISLGGKQIVDGFHARFHPGTLSVLIGPNGAGKTTVLRALAGDLEPTAGNVAVVRSGASGDQNAIPVTRLAPRALARIRAVMPQSTTTSFSFTAHEVVEMGRFATSGSQAHNTAIACRCLDRVGASHLASHAFPTLSGGEQALVTLARTIAQDTPLVLLDEPTAALDVRHQERVLTIAAELAAEGRTVVAVLHDLNLAARHADRVLVMSNGRIVADGTPHAALTASTLTAAYGHDIDVVEHPLDPARPLVSPRPFVASPT